MSDSVTVSLLYNTETVTLSIQAYLLSSPSEKIIDILILTGSKKERKRASASKNLAPSAREQWDPLRKGPRAAHTGLEQPQGWCGGGVHVLFWLQDSTCRRVQE